MTSRISVLKQALGQAIKTNKMNTLMIDLVPELASLAPKERTAFFEEKIGERTIREVLLAHVMRNEATAESCLDKFDDDDAILAFFEYLLDWLSHEEPFVREECIRNMLSGNMVKTYIQPVMPSLINQFQAIHVHAPKAMDVWVEFFSGVELYSQEALPLEVKNMLDDYHLYKQIEPLLHHVLNESECKAINPSDNAWVEAVYEKVLDKVHESAHKDAWTILVLLTGKLGQKHHGQLILKTDKIGWNFNALMSACLSHPEAVPRLLEAILKLDAKAQEDILKQISKNGWNALMLACRHHPGAVPRLLEAIKKLDAKSQEDILKQATKDGWNALMLACRFHPDAVPRLLEAILKLEDKAAQGVILKQATKDRWNALMLACRYQPEAVPRLFEAILTLDPKAQEDILKQVNKSGNNALMLACRYHPDAVPRLLEAILTLDAKTQVGILKTLMKTSFPNGDTALLLLKHMMQLPLDSQMDLLNSTKNASMMVNELTKERRLDLTTQKAVLSARLAGFVGDFKAQSGADAAVWGVQACDFYMQCHTLFNDETTWAERPGLMAKARHDFKNHRGMIQLIDEMDAALQQQHLVVINKKQYDEYAGWLFNKQFWLQHEPLNWTSRSDLPMSEQKDMLIKPDLHGHAPLAAAFVTLKAENPLQKEAVGRLHVLIKTFSKEDRQHIMRATESSLSSSEKEALSNLLHELDQDELNKQMEELDEDKARMLLEPSAPPMGDESLESAVESLLVHVEPSAPPMDDERLEPAVERLFVHDASKVIHVTAAPVSSTAHEKNESIRERSDDDKLSELFDTAMTVDEYFTQFQVSVRGKNLDGQQYVVRYQRIPPG